MAFDPIPLRTRMVERGWGLRWWTRARLRPDRYWRSRDENPYLWVRPSDIVYKTRRAFPVRRCHGAILDGDWDVLGDRFEDLAVYRAFQARFVHGAAWSDTEFYRYVVRLVAEGHETFGCRTKEEFDRRCVRIDRLYDEIAREGVQIDPYIHSSDISVNIGRRGDLLFNEGRHRLSISKLLDLPRIPVFVTVQHAAWVRLGGDGSPRARVGVTTGVQGS